MSWFQSGNLASFAKTALKEAQKTIDKALEINEADEAAAAAAGGGAQVDRVAAVTEAATDFFASWGVAVGTKKAADSSQVTDEALSETNKSKSSVKPSSDVIKNEPKGVETSSDRRLSTKSESSHQSVSHKRSASATNLESVSKSARQDNTSVMHKSLTSEIPVTLIAASSAKEDFGAARESHQQHSRSFSDTVLSAWDDCEDVQSLDEPDTLKEVASNKEEVGIRTRSEGFPSKPEKKNNEIDTADLNLLVPSKNEESGKLSTDKMVTSDLKLVDFSEVCHEDFPTEFETEYKTGAVPHLTDQLSNIDLLSTVDLNSTTSPSSYPSELSPMKDTESLFSPVLEVPSSIHFSQNVETIEVAESENNHSHSGSRNILNDDCDSSSWSWADQDSSGFVKVDSTTESHTSAVVNSVAAVNTVICEKEAEIEFKDSGMELSDVNQEISKESSVSVEEQSGTNILEKQSEEETPCNEFECQSSMDEMNSHVTSPKVASPLPSSDSTVDSPRSTSPHLDHPDSQSVSPDNLERPINQSSLLDPCDSTNQNFLSHSDETSTLTPFCSGSHSQPESSRSSSIVVIASGDRASGVPSENSSRGSTGSQDANVHDIDDHSHASSGFERVESCDAVCHVPTSPDVHTGKHKKGASSASSSDIEVIPSDYSSNSGSGGGKRSNSYYSSTIGLQTVAIPSREIDTQTDFPDESKLRMEEEMPKKLTLEISEMLAEKDQIIEQLREEGEKLSKKQHDVTQILKKLRSKEKEMENNIKGLKGEVAGKNLENERLMKTFVTKEGVEQTQKETINKLNTEKRALELKIEQMRSELEDSKENCATMKASVEEASIEILELKNAISVTQRDSSELDVLTRQKSELLSRNETLQKEVEHLRSSINSTQSKASAREGVLQKEITILTETVHALEYRLADVSSEVADATMPLSLEIEKLQEELKKSISLLEKRDSSLQSIISEYESKVTNALEREKSFKDLNLSLQSEVSKLELRVQELEYEKKDWIRESSLKLERELRSQEEKDARTVLKLEGEVRRLVEEVERLSKENDLLGMELKNEKCSTEQERKRSQSLIDQMSHNRSITSHHHTRSNSMTMNNGNTITSTQKSISGEDSPSEHSVISENSYLDEAFDSNNGPFMMMNQNNRSMTPKSFFESFSSVGLIENLQSQLRQRETEVLQFQDEVLKNEKIRKSLNEEIAKLTMQNEEFQVEMERLTELQEKLQETEKNYNALLQMYGEKVEETDELRMDLQDVKDMYKAQIETLLKK